VLWNPRWGIGGGVGIAVIAGIARDRKNKHLTAEDAKVAENLMIGKAKLTTD
jgi:hypothetical protein